MEKFNLLLDITIEHPQKTIQKNIKNLINVENSCIWQGSILTFLLEIEAKNREEAFIKAEEVKEDLMEESKYKIVDIGILEEEK